jgi:hypothetical protein
MEFWGCLLKVNLPTFRRVLTKITHTTTVQLDYRVPQAVDRIGDVEGIGWWLTTSLCLTVSVIPRNSAEFPGVRD